MRSRTSGLALGAAALLTATGLVTVAPQAVGALQHPHQQSDACPPDATALSYSDALDKLTRDGATVGGLSSLAYDRRSHAYASAVDNHGSDPERIWFFRDLTSPRVTRDPLVLRKPGGTPYTGTTADDEGLAVLPDGDYLVSSETEPSIRIFGRDGVQRAQLPVPARFRVAPAGEATTNATLEGLTISPDGQHIVAAMEGALAGDVSRDGDTTYHRFLVYTLGRHGGWQLTEQLGYRADKGLRIPEVAAYAGQSLLVEEAAFSATRGNTVKLYAVPNLTTAPDVSDVRNLSSHPGAVLTKTLVANLVRCPTLGAPAKETQLNPLLDNYEGMAITSSPAGDHGYRAGYGVSLISDDNFSAGQTTRVLNLSARLPGFAGLSGDDRR